MLSMTVDGDNSRSHEVKGFAVLGEEMLCVFMFPHLGEKRPDQKTCRVVLSWPCLNLNRDDQLGFFLCALL